MAAMRAVLLVALLAASIATGSALTLGQITRKTYRVSAAVARARAAAFQQSLEAAIWRIDASTAGEPDKLYAEDLGANGQCVFALTNATTIASQVIIRNMSGVPPPFKTYIRIGDGPYINRVVLGLPDVLTPGTGWSTFNDTSNITTWTLITSWQETDLFPRIPGWTLSQLFDFMGADANAFFCTIHTLSYKKGANRGNFTLTTSNP